MSKPNNGFEVARSYSDPGSINSPSSANPSKISTQPLLRRDEDDDDDDFHSKTPLSDEENDEDDYDYTNKRPVSPRNDSLGDTHESATRKSDAQAFMKEFYSKLALDESGVVNERKVDGLEMNKWKRENGLDQTWYMNFKGEQQENTYLSYRRSLADESQRGVLRGMFTLVCVSQLAEFNRIQNTLDVGLPSRVFRFTLSFVLLTTIAYLLWRRSQDKAFFSKSLSETHRFMFALSLTTFWLLYFPRIHGPLFGIPINPALNDETMTKWTSILMLMTTMASSIGFSFRIPYTILLTLISIVQSGLIMFTAQSEHTPGKVMFVLDFFLQFVCVVGVGYLIESRERRNFVREALHFEIARRVTDMSRRVQAAQTFADEAWKSDNTVNALRRIRENPIVSQDPSFSNLMDETIATIAHSGNINVSHHHFKPSTKWSSQGFNTPPDTPEGAAAPPGDILEDAAKRASTSEAFVTNASYRNVAWRRMSASSSSLNQLGSGAAAFSSGASIVSDGRPAMSPVLSAALGVSANPILHIHGRSSGSFSSRRLSSLTEGEGLDEFKLLDPLMSDWNFGSTRGIWRYVSVGVSGTDISTLNIGSGTLDVLLDSADNNASSPKQPYTISSTPRGSKIHMKQFPLRPLVTAVMTSLESYGYFDMAIEDGPPLDKSVVRKYFTAVEDAYLNRHDVPYHNALHATDVLQTVFAMTKIDKQAFEGMSRLGLFALLCGAAIHDVGHPGKNNAYLVASQHSVALDYNDRSVLENFHISTAFSIMNSNPALNVLRNIQEHDRAKNTNDARMFRSLVVDMVLATDLSHHFDCQTRLRACLAGKVDYNQTNDMSLICSAVLHAADIGNVAKSWPSYEPWIDLLFTEFFAQGDLERSKGMSVAPFMDRFVCIPEKAQAAFITNLVMPFYVVLKDFAPNTTEIAIEEMNNNLIKLDERTAQRLKEEDEELVREETISAESETKVSEDEPV